MGCPVTKDAASEHSQTTASAISSGCPKRPTGWAAAIFSTTLRAPLTDALKHGRVNRTGADGVDANTRLGILQGGRFGQAHHAMFTGHIGAGARHADQPGIRRRIDDGPFALGEHTRNLRFHAQPDPRQVNGNDALPVLLCAVNRALCLAGYAGIIMRAVQAAIGFDRRID